MSVQQDDPDVMDVFDDILTRDEKSHEEGVQEGQTDGAFSGYVEGFTFGWSKGWEIGSEIGFYRGYARRARDHFSAIQQSSAEQSPRKLQSVEQLLEILDRIRLDNVKAEALSDDIILARRKFKQIFPGVFKSKTDPDTSTAF